MFCFKFPLLSVPLLYYTTSAYPYFRTIFIHIHYNAIRRKNQKYVECSSCKLLTDVFPCDLTTTEYDEHLLDAIITFATFGIPFTCDELLATRNNCHIILYDLALEIL